MSMVRVVIVLLASVAALYEAGCGLMQVLGFKASGHSGFILTGSFDNPGPYGGAVAVLLSVLTAFLVIDRDRKQWYFKVLRCLSVVATALCVVVLPASMSRAAWLSFGAAFLILSFREMNLWKLMKNHRTASVAGCLVAVVVMVGMFFMKKDSAVGRIHIWHMELRAMCENPWCGSGAGTVLGAYGRAQAEYFAEKDRCESIVRVAGSPEYAFNEYLRVGVEYGLPTMIAFAGALIALVMFLINKKSPAGYGLAALSVFAFFSYPLSQLHVETDAEREWKSIRHLSSCGLYDEAVGKYGPMYESLRDNVGFLYDYGYALHKIGEYHQSNDILEDGARLSSDPMFHNIMGKNFEAMEQYDKAHACYIHAHYMVPSRLYPLVLLMEMYVRRGYCEPAAYYGRKALNLPVNDRLISMRELHERARSCVDTLSL